MSCIITFKDIETKQISNWTVIPTNFIDEDIFYSLKLDKRK